MKRLIGGVVALLTTATVAHAEPEEFQDCEDCPVMVIIPPGEFFMEIMHWDRETQTRSFSNAKITIPSKFALGKYEVTRTEFMRCVESDGCRLRERARFESDSPIADITWRQAYEYTVWLSGESGRVYRLPTGQEWEYAAKGGTATRYWWGDEEDYGNEYCTGCDGARMLRTKPTKVGRFKPNPFGLYDMMGNAAEFTGTCVEVKSEDFPTGDPPMAKPNECESFEAKGPNSQTKISEMKASQRIGIRDRNLGSSKIGFRVAAELEP